MKKIIFIFLLNFVCVSLYAQKSKAITSSLSATNWAYEAQKVVFNEEEGKPVMKILPGAGKVISKGINFSNGTIDFDIKPGSGFVSMYFRYVDANENECFYFRTGNAGNPLAMDAIQYTPYVGGVNMWDIYGQFQSNASYTLNEWNHVKMVISGSQMKVYINSETVPTLEVPYLEGNTTQGSIAFEGEASISNLVVRPGEVESLSPLPGIDPTHNDPRYIRTWAVSEPMDLPKNVDFSIDQIPSIETAWNIIEAERRGLVNLTRKFGKSESKRLVWLKLKIESEKDQTKKIALGFSDEIWVYLNGQMAYTDKNIYGTPISKFPDGRCSIENTSFSLPLKKGHNEVLIGIANDFYGWGVIARLDNLEGIRVAPYPTFDHRLVKIPTALLDEYSGTYSLPNGNKIVMTKEKNYLKLSGGDNFITALAYPMADNKFFMRDFNLELEFPKDASNKISSFLLYNNGKQIMEAQKVQQ